MTVLAIDPGPDKSAWLVLDVRSGDAVADFGHWPNEDVLDLCRMALETHVGRHPRPIVRMDPSALVIEKVEGFGMPVGREVFETVYWSGRFAEAAHPLPVSRIGRKAVKLHLCGSMRAKDPNIRQALIDRYGGSTAIGRKATPGPLYGVSGDVWSALAVAVTHADAIAEGVGAEAMA